MHVGSRVLIHRNIGGFVAGAASLLVLASTSGCATGPGRGASVQVQFYAPQGARLVVREAGGQQVREITSRGPLSDRLERSTPELAVYDLDSGRYEFAYTGATGSPDAIIYGEMEIRSGSSPAAARYCRHAFVPITLPSEQVQEEAHLNPGRDLSYTVGLEHRQFEHLKQGDVISKVYFVADLERVKREYDEDYYQAINETDRQLTVLSDREVYLDGRYEEARLRALQRDAEWSVEDRVAQDRFDTWGIEEPFVRLSRKRQALATERESLLLKRDELEAERGRRATLLRSLTIVNRDGALVLATPDLQLPFHDTVAQAAELGDVVAVVRVGGRHQHWAGGALTASESPPSDVAIANAGR
ncbi:MAG: hypothetical protein HOP29_07995 [Phycisphaerales bacterium]|nr:hypothetical protein [Phycisphaerales bacterium]